MSIFGDGMAKEKLVGNDLHNYQKLADIGTEADVPADIKSSFDRLKDKISM